MRKHSRVSKDFKEFKNSMNAEEQSSFHKIEKEKQNEIYHIANFFK